MCDRLPAHIPGHCPPTRLVPFDLATFDPVDASDPRVVQLLKALREAWRHLREVDPEYVPEHWMAL